MSQIITLTVVHPCALVLTPRRSWDNEERGSATAIFTLSPFAGPSLGPLVAVRISIFRKDCAHPLPLGLHISRRGSLAVAILDPSYICKHTTSR